MGFQYAKNNIDVISLELLMFFLSFYLYKPKHEPVSLYLGFHLKTQILTFIYLSTIKLILINNSTIKPFIF